MILISLVTLGKENLEIKEKFESKLIPISLFNDIISAVSDAKRVYNGCISDGPLWRPICIIAMKQKHIIKLAKRYKTYKKNGWNFIFCFKERSTSLKKIYDTM